jgi:hypothetical protein
MQRQADYFVTEKTIVSFLVVPAVPAIIVAGYLVLAYGSSTISDGLPAFGMIFILAYAIASAHVLVLGVPAFLLGKRLHAIRWWTCLIMAFIIGSLPITLLTWHYSPPMGWQSVFLGWGLFGVSGGFVFWILWRYWINPNERANPC